MTNSMERSTYKIPDRSQRIPEESEVFDVNDALTYIKGCDYPETSDYAIPATVIDRKIGVRGKQILEECSGTSTLAYELWMLGAEKVVSLDASKAMIDYASKKYQLNHGMEFSQGSVYNIPFPDDSFDLAVCQNSWHQLYYPFKALKEMVRVIRPRGHGVIIDFRRDCDQQALIERLEYTKPEIVPLFFDSILASFTKQEFEDMLRRIPGIEFFVATAPDPRGWSRRVDELIKIDPVPHWRDYKISQIVEVYKV